MFILDVRRGGSILAEGMSDGSGCKYVLQGYSAPKLDENRLRGLSKGWVDIPDGDFNAVFYQDQKITLVSSELNLVKWYVFCTVNRVIITDKFWSIVDACQFSLGDVNPQALYETIFCNRPLSNETWLNQISTFLQGAVVTFDIGRWEFDNHKTRKPIYSSWARPEKDAVNELNDAFISTKSFVDEEVNGDEHLISISGGLDSRLSLAYFSGLKNSAGFQIGKFPNFLEPGDMKSARRLARLAGLKFDVVDPFSTPAEEKIRLDIENNPIGPSNLMKAVSIERCGFGKPPVLITGAHGGLIGGRVLSDSLLKEDHLDSLSQKLLLKYFPIDFDLSFAFGDLKEKNKRYRFDRSGYQAISKLNEFVTSGFLVQESVKIRHLERIADSLDARADALTNVMRFHLSRHSNKGAFESLSGQTVPWSVYLPYVYELAKTWPKEWLIDRYIMKTFLREKFPYLTKIPFQGTKRPQLVDLIQVNDVSRAYIYNRVRGTSINYRSWARGSFYADLKIDAISNAGIFSDWFNVDDVLAILQCDEWSQVQENLIKYSLCLQKLNRYVG